MTINLNGKNRTSAELARELLASLPQDGAMLARIKADVALWQDGGDPVRTQAEQDFLARLRHVHSEVVISHHEGFYTATCIRCWDQSDECDTEQIARRNLALTNHGGTRP